MAKTIEQLVSCLAILNASLFLWGGVEMETPEFASRQGEEGEPTR